METDKSKVLSHYATQVDLQGVRVELRDVKGEVKALRIAIQAFEASLRAEMQKLRAELFAAMFAQTWKMVGLMVTMNIATVTAVYHIAN